MKTDIEPLTVINFVHKPFQYYQKLMKIHFTVIGPEMDGQKAKRLVKELESKLKNFKERWGSINCYLSLLEEFFCEQVHGKRVDGGWSSVHFHSYDSAKSDNVRRRNYGKVGSLIAKELKSWKFAHYKDVLMITSVEPK